MWWFSDCMRSSGSNLRRHVRTAALMAPPALGPRAITVRLARRFVEILDLMARPNGFEPLTPRFVVWGWV